MRPSSGEDLDVVREPDGSWTVYDQETGDDVQTGFHMESDAWHWVETRFPLS